MNTLEDVLTEYHTNLEFQKKFKEDPIAALREEGFELNPEDLQKIGALLNVGESLGGRITK